MDNSKVGVTMKKTFRTLIALLAVSVFLSTSAFALPSSKEAQEKVDALKEKKKATQNEVSSLQKRLTDILAKLDELEIALDKKQKEIEKAEEELAEAQEKEEEQYEDMKSRIVYMYEEGSGSAELEKIINSQSISEMLSIVEYAQNLHDYDRKKLDELIATKKKIEQLDQKLKKQKAEMEDMQSEYKKQSAALDSMIAEKGKEIADLGKQIQTAAQEVEKAKEREAEARRRAAEEAAARAAANNGGIGRTNQGNRAQQISTAQAKAATKKALATGSNPHGSAIVAAAYSQLGVPYVWGGTRPGKGLDCSGLTQYCYRCAGISIPRTSSAQLAAGTIVSNPSPGDICWTPGHVAIYIGNGQMIEAQQTGVPVKISRVRVSYYVRF